MLFLFEECSCGCQRSLGLVEDGARGFLDQPIQLPEHVLKAEVAHPTLVQCVVHVDVHQSAWHTSACP